jgi:hypothetical protein
VDTSNRSGFNFNNFNKKAQVAVEQKQVGSQPQVSRQKSFLASSTLAGGLSLIGSALLGLSSQPALAACTVTTSPNYQCSGANTAPQTVAVDNANVTTAAGFSVNTTGAGNALTILDNGALSYVDTNASTLQSSQGSHRRGHRHLCRQ